jgi:D-tyrosyl-tRNA(Tyr) deacylase
MLGSGIDAAEDQLNELFRDTTSASRTYNSSTRTKSGRFYGERAFGRAARDLNHYPVASILQRSITPLFRMRSIIQRVTQAAVVVDGKTVGEIGAGVLVLLGIEAADTREDIEWLAGKIARLRVFPDAAGAMNQSVTDIGGQALVVSQFTLFASTKKGNRPSFIRAAPLEFAERMYTDFCQELEGLLGKPVQRGVFGAHMSVQLLNDGPVTIWIDSKQKQ